MGQQSSLDLKPGARHAFRELVIKYRFNPDIPDDMLRLKNILISSPEDAVKSFYWLFETEPRERFVVVFLNTANGVEGYRIISEGTLNASLVGPREVYQAAINANAGALIILHNHPSGNPEPSHEDRMITKQLVEAGKIIGIPVHDHIIYAGEKYTSFAERGLL